jgi:hypothetical protein
MAERPDYDALAQDINLNDITSCEGNADILCVLRGGIHPFWRKQQLCIVHRDDEQADHDEDFFIDEGDDLGWLGYFIGQYQRLKYLQIYYLPGGGDQINSFFEGVSQNRSIEYLEIRCDIGIGADSWNSLGRFLENNRNLEHFEVGGFVIGHQGEQNIASAFGRMQHSSLKHLTISSASISGEGLTEIVTALESQPQLEHLGFGNNNNIGMDSCIALGNTLSRWPVSNKLETLSLPNNGIYDGGLQALAEGLMNCRSLKKLYLGGIRSITAAGLRYLSPLLQSESHSLETLHLCRIDFGDDGAIALAEGLRGNTSLKELWLSPETAGITIVGWSAFSKLLCDTSTINSTYVSNHTLTKIGIYGDDWDVGTPRYILNHLTLNECPDASISICKSKILRSHSDLDMGPFFEWKLKFLPMVISWFEKARSDGIRVSESRDLSALYKFVRGMPDLAVTGYWEGRMIHIEAKKRKLDDEMLRIADERRRLEYEEKFTLERLGDRLVDEAEVNRNKRMRHE